ncbi:MAG: DUF2461 domain-containing protein [Salinivirgaceae bacterium]|nr:DUF2461 domain-containing protein [Salinivirgaceae bacterium]
MNAISQKVMPFLIDLGNNNNRPWFETNRGRYQDVLAEFTAFVTELISRISVDDTTLANVSAKSCIYRIYRDTRFSADKTPYKTHMAASISAAGKNHVSPSFYVHFQHGNESMFGGGMFITDSNLLKQFRNEICSVPEDFYDIINAPEFRRFYPEGLWDYQKLKNVPKGYDIDERYADLLKYKHYLITGTLPDKSLSDEHLMDYLVEAHRVILPFNRLLLDVMNSSNA